MAVARFYFFSLLIASILAEVDNKEKKEKDVSAAIKETKKRGRAFNFKGKIQCIGTAQGFQELLYFSLTIMIRVKMHFSSANQF